MAYDTKNNEVEIITIHPIGRKQVEARVESRGGVMSAKTLPKVVYDRRSDSLYIV